MAARRLQRIYYRARYECDDGGTYVFETVVPYGVRVGPRGGFALRSQGIQLRGRLGRGGRAQGVFTEAFDTGEDVVGVCHTGPTVRWRARRARAPAGPGT